MAEDLLFDQSIRKLKFLYKYSGMNLKDQIVTANSFKHRWLFIFNLVWVLSASVACFYFFFVGAKQGKSFIQLTSVAPCLTFTILAIFKSFFHIFHEKEVFELIHELRELEIKENKRKKSAAKEQIIKEDIGFLNTVINVLYGLNFLMIVVFDLTPLLLMAVKYYGMNEFEMLLPYLDVFSFMPYEFKYWTFAYIHQVWSECIVLLEMGAPDYLFFTCCTYIKMQFRLLKHDLEQIIPKISSPEESPGRHFRVTLLELVTWHQDLIKASKKLEIIYSKSNLVNFLSSSLVICLTGFNVMIVDDVVVVVTFVTFFFMALMQIFFLCFFADLLASASMEVGDAIYNCRWYMASLSARKYLHVVQTRAQQPCKLTAFGYVDINLRAFTKVLGTSWSYFALLNTLYAKKRMNDM